ncbi:MAG: hypothetical protein H0W25_16445 [Acidimicrobiia bacterium]|nr:hypothetical protein [Acidimicrobiia bacterium]
MIRFIDEHRGRRSGQLLWGIEPICAVLPIAPSGYHAAKKRPPSPRALRDATLKPEVLRVWEQNLAVYGADKRATLSATESPADTADTAGDTKHPSEPVAQSATTQTTEPLCNPGRFTSTAAGTA